MIEIFNAQENQNSFYERDICRCPVIYSLRNNNEFLPPRVKAVSSATKTIKHRGQHLWVKLPHHMRNTQSINEFKSDNNNEKSTMRMQIVPQLSVYTKIE